MSYNYYNIFYYICDNIEIYFISLSINVTRFLHDTSTTSATREEWTVNLSKHLISPAGLVRFELLTASDYPSLANNCFASLFFIQSYFKQYSC